MSTPSAGAPSATTTPNLISIESNDLDRMETRASGHVEVEVGVMHPMHTPQRGHRVKHHVLEVDGGIEQHHRRNNLASTPESAGC